MKKYLVMVDTYATNDYEVEAETEDESMEKVRSMVENDEDFWSKYRKNCEIFEPTVTYADEI